ncbi:S8 family peptidase [Fimbriimonas ginsengisoli]|uniref:S8A family peptidase n=1 Tax=Fimbriimonas ginsengisoli Gsoil 348 TaxID=661478 RepID=A0A068NTH4_FIMGI|nr:S8 family peptidase [Fimbriimonas ginsengisoli]AIE86746.1 S8A family peptidase [Fimbriimonas ginsengisoli Gsoil 348]
MSRTRFCLTVALGATLAGIASAGTAAYVPGQILVKFKADSLSARGVAHAAIAASVSSENARLGYQVVQLPKSLSVEAAMKYYRALPGVQYAEPNYIAYATFTPNDPQYNKQYAHPRINSPAAWDLSFGSSSVKIAIIDTGVDYNHEDLAGKVIKGKDFVNNDDDPMDDNGHGTHCSGIAAAKTNNGVGVAGIGFNCTILAEKVLGANGSGSVDGIAKAIVDATDRGVDVISMSIGGPDSQPEHDAIDAAWNKGIVVVAAAGNSNTNSKSYPGAYENAIGVGASDQNDKKADFSNFGADWVDVAAPGVDILSSLPGNKYGLESGTSMACPLVAGLVGLMKSYGPNTSGADLRKILEANTDNIGTWIAKGRINAFKALSAIIKPVESEFNVKTIGVYANQGTNLTGSPAALAKADVNTVTLSSTNQPNVGTVAALTTGLLFTADPAKVRSSSMLIEGSTLQGVTLQVYLRNFNTGAYDLVKAFSATGASQTFEFPLTKLSSYVSGTTVNAIIRGFRSSSSRGLMPFKLTLDVVKIKASVNP